MLFFTYLRRELRHRRRQAILIALGLAVGVGLVITVSAASSGVAAGQRTVLHSLYGIGTDMSVTTPAADSEHREVQPGTTAQQIDTLEAGGLGKMDAATVRAVARQRGVTAATGTLSLMNTKMTVPAAVAVGPPGSRGTPSQGNFTMPTRTSVLGVDPAHLSPGPLGGARITAGRTLRAADASADVAVISGTYAKAETLKLGSTVTLAGTKFTVVGVVNLPQGSSPQDVYIPLSRAQALSGLAGKVNTVYVTAATAADVAAVARRLTHLLPTAQVTTSASLARQITGSLASTARLANELGRWLMVAVLAAAFAVASLLTVSGVARRVREFGTLKAVGWRTRRITGQVLGESVTTGILGGAAGIGLGFAGAALVKALVPTLHATVGDGGGGPSGGAAAEGGQHAPQGPGRVLDGDGHTILVHLTAPVTAHVVLLAVALAVAGGLLAGLIGGWRAARLRPADALARVE
ncbi:MAG: ABC transporter permease [Mycobacteriales bacterium]